MTRRSKPALLVTGATGNVGRAVVEEAKRLEVPIRAGVRDPVRVADSLGVEVELTGLDLARPETYEAALAGVGAVFLMRPPALANVSETLLVFIDRAREAGVGHIAFLSVVGAERARFIPHRKVEQHLLGAGVPWTFLRAGFFHQNLADAYRRDIVEEDRILLPAGSGKAAWVDARDVGMIAARALAKGALRHRALELVGPERLDFHSVAQILSQVAGRAVRYEPASIPRYVRHCRGRGEGWGLVAVKTALHAALRFDHHTAVDPTLAQLLDERPRDVRSYVEEHAALWSKSP